ncbi:hypothetical protein HPB52_013859 [Rhipicephalus sanguineus]|uniref:Uncharacterized protein n=1 Tax=Rhipicephalus sanguineus TaxID=34632 RepID=A0A9D4PMV9_RHISA|nr:hypothetical protein HPB52_013859 [Rhipicephalus sanguineus]
MLPISGNSKGFVPFFEDPFKQGLVLSGRSMAALQTPPPPSLQPCPAESRAEFAKTAASYYTPPSESETFQSVVGGISDVARPSPVTPFDGEHWNQGSVSPLFSHSTGGEEFDDASLSSRMSSVAEDCNQRDHRFAWSRCNQAVAFLATVAIVCISALMVHMTLTVLSDGNARHLLEEARDVTPTEPSEGDSLQQNAPIVELPSPTKVKPPLNTSTGFFTPDTESKTFLADVSKPPLQVFTIMQPLGNVTGQKHKRDLSRMAPFPPRRMPLKRRRALTWRVAAPPHHHRDIEVRPSMRVAPTPRPPNQRCGLSFYTYCSKLRHEAYYRHSTHSCVLTIMDDVQVCNHSPNKFVTLGECQRRCVHTPTPSVACLEKPLFSWCSRGARIPVK